ncbi:hypothetical protein BU24DRAFT_420525 [Aaosphaeria arxii CBS 175.79]|uniref:DUF7357 domain-containing protein n=1 Tax=Aaosphaeria arxii CBS 175.79 TaxID=1450172 RepID=A0A6A5XYX6_9PLEO|nr:uncharacterized protein BU24DRAFT_420525 [Aaosphaeria arxii CBS 175.79]KAF2017484.1 hypothetical protein BU24DRAFT_420525 [Aaosphaeria arxii CBS 175.79]
MRLRLSVQRNRLPQTQALWTVPEANKSPAYTIARLLEDVNLIFPLEGDHWGLDDYAVEVGGFECLHFSPVAHTLRDDDIVCIRPLMTTEVRERSLGGRNQISEGGQHLLDGIPFGRPYLRDPNRPPIRIPPPRQARLVEITDNAMEEHQSVGNVGLIMAHGESPSDHSAKDLQNRGESKGTHKAVRFEDLPVDQLGSEESDDEDFAPEDDLDVSMDDLESGSDGASGDESSADSDPSGSGSHSSSDSDSESGGDEGPEERSTKVKPYGPPGSGSKSTWNRNQRRKEQARLQKLKEQGVLDADAGFKELRALSPATRTRALTNNNHSTTPSKTTVGMSSQKRKRDDQEDEDSSLERRRIEMLAKIDELQAPATPVDSSTPPSASKRLRPDVSAFKRIISHQAQPLHKRAPKSKAADEQPSKPLNTDPDLWKSKLKLSAFECWEEEYELSAPPFPFKQHWDPASKLMRQKAAQEKQKWQKKRDKKNVSNKNNDPDWSNAPNQGYSPIEQHQEGEESIVLDYGDALDSKTDADVMKEVDAQIVQDVATSVQEDLPPIPDDVASLPSLSQDDIRIGTVIVFKVCEINMKTIQPEFSDFKTAIVEEEGDSGNGAGTIGLRLAQRDLPRREKEVDKKGGRVYSLADHFGINGNDDEDVDVGLVHHHFHELLEAKLLKKAAE